MAILANLFRVVVTANHANMIGDDVYFGKWDFFDGDTLLNSQLHARVDLSSPSYGISSFDNSLLHDGSSGGFVTNSRNPAIAAFESVTPVSISRYDALLSPQSGAGVIQSWTLEYSTNNGGTWEIADTVNNASTTNTLNPGHFNITATNIITPPPVTPTMTPEEILAADKAKLATIVADLKTGIQILDDDAIFYNVGGVSAKAEAIMAVLDSGGGYPELVAANTAQALGLSDATILRCMSIYLVKVDTVKFQNEAGLSLVTDYARLKSFTDYLAAHSITPPPLTPILSALRSNMATFNAARAWAATNPA